MAVTYAETLTTGRQLWSNDEQTTPSVWGWYEQHLIAWMGDLCNPQLGAITAGSGYQDGTYQNVELRRKDYALNTGGKHMLATVTVVGGGVSTVAITRKGNGFKTGDTLVIYNLAEVGGTGSGYEQIVDSADASIGFILDTQQATYPTYTVGMKIGMDRDDSYNMGSMWFKSSNTSTTYVYECYSFTESTSNNGYGSWVYQTNQSIATWYETNGDGYRLQVFYCSEPDNTFFIWSDSAYSPLIGWFKCLQPGAGPWPSREVTSDWVHLRASAGSVWNHVSAVKGSYSDAYVGATSRSLLSPSDTGVLWGNQTIYGRSFVQGVQPSRLKSHSGLNFGWGHEYTDDLGNVFKKVGNTSGYNYVQMND